MATRIATLAAAAMVAAGVAVAPPTAAAEPVVATFSFTGGPQTYTVPPGVTTVDIVACGAQGGGPGGRATSTVPVSPGEELTVMVGGRGVRGVGGFNGGGTGVVDPDSVHDLVDPDGRTPTTGGGGASDVRRGGAELADRVVVGGGGGGDSVFVLRGGWPDDVVGIVDGGAGGGTTGADGPSGWLGFGPGGTGGTQTAGGTSSSIFPWAIGALGQGGAGGFAAGGGGGLHGGGAGALGGTALPGGGDRVDWRSGGGGGSGLGDTLETGVCEGDGWVTIRHTPTVTTHFDHTGVAQTYTVPPGVTTVDVVACGAQGGGPGGRASSSLAVTPGEVLTVTVGGAGAPGQGGFNGGGDGWSGFLAGGVAGGGGGASDIRRAGSELVDRVVIGGGGGGNGFLVEIDPLGTLVPRPRPGGAGGGAVGGDGGGSPTLGGGGGGGTATTGGSGTDPGTLGRGGSEPLAGGGGGGLFGGGSGGFLDVAQPDGSRALVYGGGGGGSGLGDELVNGVCRGDGWVTITPVGATPLIRPFGAVVTEGDSGTTVAEVVVHLEDGAGNPVVSSEPITVDWATIDTPADGVAQLGVDVGAASGTLTFPPGVSRATVPVEVFGDTVDEPPLLYGEWALVHFTDPSPGTAISPVFFGLGLVIILDDD